MSLYNMLFGHNSNAANLLYILNLHPAQIPRFRDVYWDGEFIVVHTRTGGGNREYYENEEMCRTNYPDYFTGDEPPTGPWNDDLRAAPGYVRDEDAEFDATYANFYFKPPAEAGEALAGLPPDLPPAAKWEAVMKALDEKRKTSKEPQ